MKLLDKTAVISKQNAERKSVIDSGIELAKKVDYLRQEALRLEKERNDFINGSREAISKELDKLKEQKRVLEQEIGFATEALKKLREPLDGEWKLVRKEETRLSETQIKAEAYLNMLVSKEQLLETKTAEVELRIKQLTAKEDNLHESLTDAQKDKQDAHVLFEQARKLKEQLESDIFVRNLELETWQRKLTEKETELKKDREALNKERKAFEIKKKRWTT